MRRIHRRLVLVFTLVLSLAFGCSDDADRDSIDGGNLADTASRDDSGNVDPADAGTADTGSPDTGDQPDAEDAGRTAGWTPTNPLAAGPRQETAVVELDDKIYVIGGYNAAIQIVPTVEVWDPSTGEWDRIADLPVPMHHANAAAYDGKLWVLGFLGPGFAADGRSFVWDPQTDRWTPIADMPAGTERGSSAIVAIDDRIYVVGGLRGGAVTDASFYDPTDDTWTPLDDAPRPFDHAAFGVLNGELVVAGGRNQSIGAHVPDVDIYDPVANDWRSGAPMPTSRGGVAAAVYDGSLYVFGGEGNRDDPSGVYPQVEAYDPGTDAWTELDAMPDPRHGMGAASFDGGILIPGGAREQAFGAVEAADIYVP